MRKLPKADIAKSRVHTCNSQELAEFKMAGGDVPTFFFENATSIHYNLHDPELEVLALFLFSCPLILTF
jgi:hypothetical protein